MLHSEAFRIANGADRHEKLHIMKRPSKLDNGTRTFLILLQEDVMLVCLTRVWYV